MGQHWPPTLSEVLQARMEAKYGPVSSVHVSADACQLAAKALFAVSSLELRGAGHKLAIAVFVTGVPLFCEAHEVVPRLRTEHLSYCVRGTAVVVVSLPDGKFRPLGAAEVDPALVGGIRFFGGEPRLWHLWPRRLFGGRRAVLLCKPAAGRARTAVDGPQRSGQSG